MNYLEKAKEFGLKALEKGREVGSIAKVKLEIAKMEMDISELKKKIGNIVYTENINTGNSEVEKMIEKIDSINEKIKKKEKELEK